MSVVMNMGSCEIERDEGMEAEYGEEVLCSGWNPVIALAYPQHSLPETDIQMPPNLTAADAEAFLQKMYAYQR